MRNLTLLALFFLCSCDQRTTQEKNAENIDALAANYVKLALVIGQYDGDFVDAYYGPDSLKPLQPKQAIFPKDSLLLAVRDLKGKLNQLYTPGGKDSISTRANWIMQQLTAFDRRIRVFSGEYGSFDEESEDLFGVKAPLHNEAFFKTQVAIFDSLLPGPGAIAARFQALANTFIIPKDKLDTVFKTTIAEARRQTSRFIQLPANENFVLEYVKEKPWSGYNWYKGNFQSLIQINTDLDIFIDRAIDVGSHESYPGHHVYNMLLERNLYRDKGHIEISLYPLFSPQSLIAEGSANYGIEMIFPGDEKIAFSRDVLLPLAGMDTTGISTYYHAMGVKRELNFARNEVARGLVNGTMTEAEAMRWLQTYSLYNEETARKSISFIKKYRSYVITYNHGQELVRAFIEKNAPGITTDRAKRWESFRFLLSNALTPADLK